MLDFLRRLFFRDEPLNVAVGLVGPDQATCVELEDYCLESIPEGTDKLSKTCNGNYDRCRCWSNAKTRLIHLLTVNLCSSYIAKPLTVFRLFKFVIQSSHCTEIDVTQDTRMSSRICAYSPIFICSQQPALFRNALTFALFRRFVAEGRRQQDRTLDGDLHQRQPRGRSRGRGCAGGGRMPQPQVPQDPAAAGRRGAEGQQHHRRHSWRRRPSSAGSPHPVRGRFLERSRHRHGAPGQDQVCLLLNTANVRTTAFYEMLLYYTRHKKYKQEVSSSKT